MNLFSLQSRIIVTCSNRLSNYLQQEISELGFVPVRIFKTGVELFGTMQDCIRLNLNLRCASQVLFSIKEFTVYDASDLYNTLVKVEWEKIIPAEENFSITSNVTNETITNNLFANVKVKDAIADRFREKTGVPILLNTSFNENEPIVNSPTEALDCFLRTQMDMLVLENCVIERQ
jgi:putative N6-adenine-specific DNA methylase